jgi:hypothetical protein
MWLKAEHTLSRIAELGQREGVIFCLENLNTAVDHPGTPFARAADTLGLVTAVDNTHLRLMLDIYHAQIGEGNLVELINACAPYIGEVQVADVPGRCEPGTGEINYPASLRRCARSATRAPLDSRLGHLWTASSRWNASGLRSLWHVSCSVCCTTVGQLLRGCVSGPGHDRYRQPGASDQRRRDTTEQDPADGP